jgi:hypothetical protein
MCLSAVIPIACGSDGGGRAAVGSVAEPFLPASYVVNVAIDPATYHFAVPSELLMSSEGCGPRSLSLAVSASVTPHISFTGTRTPSHSELSAALGWDVARQVQLTADTVVLVPVDAYARVDSYTTYQKTTWALVGLAGVPLGLGATYRPVGVFFSTCGCIGSDPCASCAPGFPPGVPGGGGPGPGQGTVGTVAPAQTGDAGADGG